MIKPEFDDDTRKKHGQDEADMSEVDTIDESFDTSVASSTWEYIEPNDPQFMEQMEMEWSRPRINTTRLAKYLDARPMSVASTLRGWGQTRGDFAKLLKTRGDLQMAEQRTIMSKAFTRAAIAAAPKLKTIIEDYGPNITIVPLPEPPAPKPAQIAPYRGRGGGGRGRGRGRGGNNRSMPYSGGRGGRTGHVPYVSMLTYDT